MDINTLLVLFPLLLFLGGLGFTVMIDPYIQRKQRRIMLLIVVLCLSLTCFSGSVSVYHSAARKKMACLGAGWDQRRALLQLSLYKALFRDQGK